MSQKQQTMKTIIAEKPSVAKEIAHIVGADKREEGYMQGNGYYVTWAFGHLVYAIKAAAEEAGITPETSVSDTCDKMKEAMLKITVNGLTGENMTWTEDGIRDA